MFNPTRLALARQHRGLTKSALAELIGRSPRSISAYESGSPPPEEVIQDLARALDYPLGFFGGADVERPETDAISFRALSKMTAAERDRAISAGALASELNSWLEERFDLPQADLPDHSWETDPESAADQVRQEWNLGLKPISNLVHLMESRGVRVFSLDVDSLNVDAFSYWLGGTPVVFLNTRKSAERSRFDAAHEMGHLILHRHSARDNTKAQEREAQAFASAFLMPQADVLARAPRFVTVNRLIELKKRWGVSVAALNHRLHAVGVTNNWQYRQLSIQIAQKGYRTDEPNSIPRESSSLFAQVFSSLREASISQGKIAHDLQLPESAVSDLLHGLTVTSIRGKSEPVTKIERSRSHLKLVK